VKKAEKAKVDTRPKKKTSLKAKSSKSKRSGK